jgi:hypothetical protein
MGLIVLAAVIVHSNGWHGKSFQEKKEVQE